jgi:hypothetical protein
VFSPDSAGASRLLGAAMPGVRFILLPLLLLPVPALAQETDEQLWTSATASVRIAPDASVAVESVVRFGDKANGLADVQFGGSLSYKASKRMTLTIGYRHVQDHDNGEALDDEDRLRQIVAVQLGGGFNGQMRFEERFQDGTIGVRIRPQVKYTLPLGSKGFALFASSEHFFNLNGLSLGVDDGYERMRNAVGVSIPLAKHLKGDLGYLNEYRFGKDGKRDQMNNILTFALTLSL